MYVHLHVHLHVHVHLHYIHMYNTCIHYKDMTSRQHCQASPRPNPAQALVTQVRLVGALNDVMGTQWLVPTEAGDDGASSKATQVPVTVVPSLDDFRGTHGDLGNLRIENTYPLVIYDSYETSPCSIGKSFIHGPFSIAMPKFQRVDIYNYIYIYSDMYEYIDMINI